MFTGVCAGHVLQFSKEKLSSIDALLKQIVSSLKPLYRNFVSIQTFIIQKISFLVYFR